MPDTINALLDRSTIVIPAKNEAKGLETLLPDLLKHAKGARIIVVDDGSIDGTADICETYGVKTIRHLHSKGNGASIKNGARHADSEILIFMDADSQHDPKYIRPLLEQLADGADMAIGARNNGSQASLSRLAANNFYNLMASWMVNEKVPDLTSGFRAVYRDKFLEFLDLLPNGFSYPTTITIAFFRAGYTVAYVPIKAKKRLGKSHVDIKKDGIRFLLIIFKIGTLYSPLKVFFPVSAGIFSTGMFYYLYTFLTAGRFTNMSALLFTSSIIIFLMGLVAEQINNLQYSLLSKNKG
ncbi:glycosyltransferase family 2 protein [uncultured Desulfobacter sp.]|uniref:glycosyltransferase family 2 protein n=1 Tax=uncultured Desulfobacter sp. TaxID=240139 RepID=UPI002AA8DE5A|nr:glycosyltransferase family 2 protein [uncultured Desulfobacter sp.]